MNSLYSSPGFIIVGRVTDAHGIRGQIHIVFFPEILEDLPNLAQAPGLRLLKTINGQPTCRVFVIDHSSSHKDGYIVKLKDVNDRNFSETLKGSLIEIPQTCFVSRHKGELSRDILYFTVFNGEREVGRVKGFSSNGAQRLLLVNGVHGEFAVPLVKQFIVDLDTSAQILRLNFPPDLENLDLA